MKKLLLASLIVLIVILNFLIIQKEVILSNGTVILMKLAPYDPRSLMQGDYMELRYEIAGQIEWDRSTFPSDGHIVVCPDNNGVAAFKRIHSSDKEVSEGEHLIRYRIRNEEIRFGVEAFFFQEGTADCYEKARYGELRVADNGDVLLTGLRDENFLLLEPDKKGKVQ